MNPSTDQSLRKALANWQDFDIACYRLACALGVLPPFDGTPTDFISYKFLFWGANPLGETLCRFLDELVKCDVLEFDQEEIKYRWNPDFKVPLSHPEQRSFL